MTVQIKDKEQISSDKAWYKKYAGSTIEVYNAGETDCNGMPCYKVLDGSGLFPDEMAFYANHLSVRADDVVIKDNDLPVRIKIS